MKRTPPSVGFLSTGWVKSGKKKLKINVSEMFSLLGALLQSSVTNFLKHLVIGIPKPLISLFLHTSKISKHFAS